MESNAETNANDSQMNSPLESSATIIDPQELAIKQFEGIKQALVGAKPAWLLPLVNSKALASQPYSGLQGSQTNS